MKLDKLRFHDAFLPLRQSVLRFLLDVSFSAINPVSEFEKNVSKRYNV